MPSSNKSADCHRCLDCPPSISIPTFCGSGDCIGAADWIDMYDFISTDYNYSSANKFIRLGSHLRKYALSWYIEEMKRHVGDIQECNWQDLKESFKKHFILCNMVIQSSVSSVASSYV